LCEVLPRGYGLHFVRRRSHLPVSLGLRIPRFEALRLCGDDAVHLHSAGRLHLPLEEGRARLAQIGTARAKDNVTGNAKEPGEVVVQKLSEWNAAAVAEVILFRGDRTVVV